MPTPGDSSQPFVGRVPRRPPASGAEIARVRPSSEVRRATGLPYEKSPCGVRTGSLDELERVIGFEPTTTTLARSCSAS